MHMHGCVYVCMYVHVMPGTGEGGLQEARLHVFECVCVCMYVCKRHICMYMYVCVYVCMYASKQVCMYGKCKVWGAPGCAPACICMCVYVRMRACLLMYVCMCVYTHIHTYIHTYIHTFLLHSLNSKKLQPVAKTYT